MSRRRHHGIVLCVVLAAATAPPAASGSGLAVPAVREPLTTDATSPVAHDNEVMALAPHAGRLFAATDQWEYPGADAFGQVLVRSSRAGAWRVFEQTQSHRVQALASFALPRGGANGRPRSLLVTQAIVGGRSQIQWLLDGARSFSGSFALASRAADVRSFGAHASGATWAVYAGVNPTGILRGVWSPSRRTLVFGPRPELTVAPPASGAAKTQKVTGFADCAGALFASINTRLYRRSDGVLARGAPRWSLVYEIPAAGRHNSGLRGLSCIHHGRAAALLVSTEGTGDVYRLDRLHAARLRPTLELSTRAAIRSMLAALGTTVPSDGAGSVGYVIAAYNTFEPLRLGGATRRLFGIEWRYAGPCAPGRVCAPSGYDAAACFAIRTDAASAPAYALRCLHGPQFTPAAEQPSPVRSGQAFVAIRTIKASPFGDGRVYFAGFDCNFSPADGAAWVGSARAGDVL